MLKVDFVDIDRRVNSIDNAHASTFEWPFAVDSPFACWLREGSGMFWIKGKAGSGKSTLMKHIVHDRRTTSLLHEWAKDKDLLIAHHFFWLPGSALQKSYQGLLQTLLSQLCSTDSSLAKGWTSRTLEQHNQQADRLAAALHTVLESDQHRYCIFIDGLDEFCPEMEQAQLIRRLKQMTSLSNVKMCVSSRQWSLFERVFADIQQICLQDLTRDDMYTCTTDVLQGAGLDMQVLSSQQFSHQIVAKSEGVFLWLRLVLSSMFSRLCAGQGLSKLKACLDEFPGDLEEYLYKLVYERINPTWRQGKGSETARALFLAKILLEDESGDASCTELFWMAVVQTQVDMSRRDFYKNFKTVLLQPDDYTQLLLDTRAVIRAACQDMLRCDVAGDRNLVDFTHRSIYDLLRTKRMVDLIDENVPSHFLEGDLLLRLLIANIKRRVALSPKQKHNCVLMHARHLFNDILWQFQDRQFTDGLLLHELDLCTQQHKRFCNDTCRLHYPTVCSDEQRFYREHPDSGDWVMATMEFMLMHLVAHGQYQSSADYIASRGRCNGFFLAAFGCTPNRGLLLHHGDGGFCADVLPMRQVPPKPFIKMLTLLPGWNKHGLEILARQWHDWNMIRGKQENTEEQERLWQIAKILFESGAVVPRSMCLHRDAVVGLDKPYICIGRNGTPFDDDLEFHECAAFERPVLDLLCSSVPVEHHTELKVLLEQARHTADNKSDVSDNGESAVSDPKGSDVSAPLESSFAMQIDGQAD